MNIDNVAAVRNAYAVAERKDLEGLDQGAKPPRAYSFIGRPP